MKAILVLASFLAILAVVSASLLQIQGRKERQNQCDCPSGETCCTLAGGQIGCCPAENACCCPDQQHCCGVGKCTCTGTCPGSDCQCTSCAATGQCSNEKASLFAVHRE